MSEDVAARMRDDWNARAQEDANYYVAFGRRQQDEAEFFATGERVAASLLWETERLDTTSNQRARRALEIGCGPGRLIRPLSQHFGEIHGVDVSDEMIHLARERLRGIPHAHVHVNQGSELAQFADASFDFVYSYAVFQHIPSREVIVNYLRETRRILKPRGIARLHFNGLPQNVPSYDTWAGVRFAVQELIEFTRELDFQILALEGASTQYLWTTWRKREPGWRETIANAPPPATTILRTTSAQNSEPVVPNRGPFASLSVWARGVPDDLDLFDLEIDVGGLAARPTYIGPPHASGLQQMNAILTESDNTGLVPVQLRWCGKSLCPPAVVRMIPAGPQVPRIVSVSDGVNLMSGNRIQTGSVKVVMEDVARPDEFAAQVDGLPGERVEVFCTDPLPRRYEVNFHLPEATTPGSHVLELRLGRRRFAPILIEVTPN
jgi:ubiquinone/menaquinone biosynthesis C-methylase UbiE